jgi:rubredoxin
MAKTLTCPKCGKQGAMKPAKAKPNHVRCSECGHVFAAQKVSAPSVLSGSLVPEADPQNIRKPRSILRENLLFFAVMIPLVLLAGAVIYGIIAWVDAARR